MSYYDISDASQIGQQQAQAQANGTVELVADGIAALPDETWLVDSIGLTFFDPTQINCFANPSISGIFLCPPSTPAKSNQPVAIPLPTDGAGAFWADSLNGQTFSRLQVTKPIIVPPNWFLRAIYNSDAVTPGNGAVLTLNWSYIRRKVNNCAAIKVCQ